MHAKSASQQKLMEKEMDKSEMKPIPQHKRGTGGGGGSPCKIRKREGGMGDMMAMDEDME